MLKVGTIIEINHPLSRFGMVDRTNRNATRLIGQTGLALDYETGDTSRMAVIGRVEVGKKMGTPSGNRFCNCNVYLGDGKGFLVSVLVRQPSWDGEITSVVEIRQLAWVKEETQEYLAQFAALNGSGG